MFQEHLAKQLGLNIYGEPLFRIIWGQTETELVCGTWGTLEERLIGKRVPCWMVQKWNPPELYGTPEIYYTLMLDSSSGIPLLGPYPERGRYETVLKFDNKDFDKKTGELSIRTIPMDWAFMDWIVPILQKSLEVTYWECKRAQEAIEIEENTAAVAEIADRLMDSNPSFYGPTSYAGHMSSHLDKKAEIIEKEWKRLGLDKRPKPARGFFQKPS